MVVALSVELVYHPIKVVAESRCKKCVLSLLLSLLNFAKR